MTDGNAPVARGYPDNVEALATKLLDFIDNEGPEAMAWKPISETAEALRQALASFPVEFRTPQPTEATIVWLRNVGDSEDDCWVPCAIGDSGAVEFTAHAQPEQQTDEMGLYDLGESFLAEYERAVKDGSLPGFICADSPVEVLYHLINQVDDLHAALEPFAAVAQSDIGQDEADTDVFQPMRSGRNRAPLITVGDMRRAASSVTSTDRGGK